MGYVVWWMKSSVKLKSKVGFMGLCVMCSQVMHGLCRVYRSEFEISNSMGFYSHG